MLVNHFSMNRMGITMIDLLGDNKFELQIKDNTSISKAVEANTKLKSTSKQELTSGRKSKLRSTLKVRS